MTTPTTYELIERFDPCEHGRLFAQANPDPRRAIEVALAEPPHPERPGTIYHPWGFVRWAVLALSDHEPTLARAWRAEYNAATDEQDNYDARKHTEGCARRLLAWLDEKYPIGGEP